MNNEFHTAHVKLAEVFSSVTMIGPPMGEKLFRLIAHVFTPEEALAAAKAPMYYPRPLEKIARRAGRPAQELKPLLDSLASRRIIVGVDKGYCLLPLIPGMFEYMLMGGEDTPWHREYARLLVDLFGTGYMKKYNQVRSESIRNIPVQAALRGKNEVVTTDLMSEMLERQNKFGVINVCQCRQSTHFIGKDCKRATPEDGCLLFGSFVDSSVKRGTAREVSREQMKDIVQERWEKKLVFFTGNFNTSAATTVICTCCDCCCHGLETFNHYHGEGLVAPPHFLAAVDESKCKPCGKCAKACNTYAHTFVEKKHLFDQKRCIGCGLCVSECKEGAISLKVNPAWRAPSQSFTSLAIKLIPSVAFAGIKAKMSK